MKTKQILLALGIVALSATTMAQPNRERDHNQPAQPHQPAQQHNSNDPNHRALNPQPLPPSYRHDRDNRRDRDHRPRDRDFRTDRDHRRWNDHDHRRNFELHRDHHHELAIGMRKRQVLEFEWWKNPIYTRINGPFSEYIYADSRFGRCSLLFRQNRLVEIRC